MMIISSIVGTSLIILKNFEDLVFELSFKDILQLENKLNFCISNEINKINDTTFHFTFSYGRALQQSALKTWSKSMSDTKKVQKVFDHRANMNGASTQAKWDEKLEQNFAA